MTPEVINYYVRSYYEGGRLLCYVEQSITGDIVLALITYSGALLASWYPIPENRSSASARILVVRLPDVVR
jgi:hypothetical protein